MAVSTVLTSGMAILHNTVINTLVYSMGLPLQEKTGGKQLYDK
jgi:hypothetical protein